MTRDASRTDRRATTSITRVVGWALLLVSLVPFLPLVYLSWVDYRRNVGEIEREIQDTNRQLARLAGNYLETFLAQLHRDATIVTVLPDPVVGLGSPRQGIRWEVVGATRLVAHSQVSPTRLGRPCEYDRFLDRLDSRPGVQVSEVGRWRAGSQPSVIVGVRFPSAPRYLVGILEPEVLHRELTAISGDALDRHIYVVDERGGLIFYSDMEVSRRGDDLRDNPPIRMHLRREQGPLRFRSVVSGKERLGHVLRLPDTGWGVVVSADLGSRLISLRNRYQTVSWLIAFAMLTALGIFVLTSRRLVRPVLRIREALRRDHRPEHAPLDVPDSSRRIAEYDELIEALDGLAERIATTEQQLIQAERASLLGQMASGIAHEVGTPLNVITGHAQYLMRKLPEDDPTYATLQMIVKQAERIAEMVRRLLGFSHPMKAELMPVDLHELVVQTLDMIAGFTTRLHVQLDHDPDTPMVLGDPKLLEHVLLNLMMNACQAMPDGGRLSTVIGLGKEVGADPIHGDSWVCFRIADTGVGIAPQHVPRIFEPFFTTKAQGQGTGLGLAIVERIVKQHMGQIEVSSRLGAGTVFTMRLRPCERARDGE